MGIMEILRGEYGFISCFSTQTYKHLNSGEGGLITINDPDTLANVSQGFICFMKNIFQRLIIIF